MRETQKGQSETQRDLTVAIPMSDEGGIKALMVFAEIDGDLPISAVAECVNDTSLNDAAYSCHIRPKGTPNEQLGMAGIKFFLGNPDEGFDYAQAFCGNDPAQTPCDWDEDETDTWDDLPTFQAWLFHQMTEAKHPLFKQIGMTPLKIETMEHVRTYLTLLANHGLSYHMDDDPWDCLVHNEVRDAMGRKHRKSEFTMWEGVLLTHYHNLCWAVCHANEQDIHEVCWQVHQPVADLLQQAREMRPDVRSAVDDKLDRMTTGLFEVLDNLKEE